MNTLSELQATKPPNCDCVSPDEHLCTATQEEMSHVAEVRDELNTINDESSTAQDTINDGSCTIKDDPNDDAISKIRIVSFESIAESVRAPRKKPRQTKALPPSSERSFVCDVCGKGFKTRPKLIFHQTSVHEEARYRCEQCGKCFSQTGSLNRHLQMVHRKVRASPCPHCGKTFSSSHYLKFHIDNVHLGSSANQCSECGKGFYNANNLRMHIDSVHRQVLSHFCSHCGKGFVQIGNLTRHVESVHNGIKRFPCECGKAFTSSKSLNRHRFSRNHNVYHSDEKTFTEALVMSMTKDIQANHMKEVQKEDEVITIEDDCEEMPVEVTLDLPMGDNAKNEKEASQEKVCDTDEIHIATQETDNQPKKQPHHQVNYMRNNVALALLRSTKKWS